jgi:hypothetical protein
VILRVGFWLPKIGLPKTGCSIPSDSSAYKLEIDPVTSHVMPKPVRSIPSNSSDNNLGIPTNFFEPALYGMSEFWSAVATDPKFEEEHQEFTQRLHVDPSTTSLIDFMPGGVVITPNAASSTNCDSLDQTQPTQPRKKRKTI